MFRITLEMSDTLRRRIEGIRNRLDIADHVEVFRRAIAVLDLITIVHAKGWEVVVRRPDGSETLLNPQGLADAK